jgi:hypothetical protein
MTQPTRATGIARLLHTIRTARRRHRNRYLRRNADWVAQARTTPTLRTWTEHNPG